MSYFAYIWDPFQCHMGLFDNVPIWHVIWEYLEYKRSHMLIDPDFVPICKLKTRNIPICSIISNCILFCSHMVTLRYYMGLFKGIYSHMLNLSYRCSHMFRKSPYVSKLTNLIIKWSHMLNLNDIYSHMF